MAAAPIETMKVGGMLWFTDLTLPDPYYLLPVAACLTFMANIEVLLPWQYMYIVTSLTCLDGW